MMLALSKKYAGWAMHSQTFLSLSVEAIWKKKEQKTPLKNNADDSYFKSKYLWKLLVSHASFVAQAIAVLDHNFDPNWNILSEMSRQILG